MFSIKQFIINLSSEARQELRNLIDEIEENAPTETLNPTPTPAPSAEVDAAPIETEDPAAE